MRVTQQIFFSPKLLGKWEKRNAELVFCYQNCSYSLWEKSCSSDREKLLKLEADGWEFTKLLRSLEQWNSTLEPVSTGQHKITQNR